MQHGIRLIVLMSLRRRLERRGPVVSTRARMNWAGAAVLWVLAAGFVLVPLAAAARGEEHTAAADDAKPQVADSTVPPAATDEPFTATFSNGVQVQLIGLSENPSKGKPWWAPDGSRLDDAPYARVPAVMHADENQLAREICFRWKNLPDNPDFATRWGVLPRGGGMGGGNAFDATEKRIEDLNAWAVVIPSGDTCTVQFLASVRATPWLTVFTARGGNMSSMGGTIDGVRQGAIFSASKAEDGGTAITVSYQIPDKAVRLLAVANDGLPDVGTARGGAGVLDFSQVTYHFANLAPDNIQRFELQSQKRFFETIEFRNVSLHPDKQTQVEIVRLAAEMPKNDPAAATPAPRADQDRYRRSVELMAELVKEHGYGLDADQPLKRIPPPFAPARDELWAMNSSPTLFAANATDAPPRNEPVRPGIMLMQWTGTDLLNRSFHFSEPTLRQILDRVFALKLQDVQGDLSLLATQVPGDWIVRWDPQKDHVSNAKEIAELERILRDDLHLPVRLELHEIERPVYVAKGSYKFSPVIGPDGKTRELDPRVAAQADGDFHIPLRRSNIAMSVVRFPELLQSLGEVILFPIVDEVATPPKKESFFLRYSGNPPPDPLAPFSEAQVKAVLATITKQTGLEFVKETRPVKTLLIQRDGAR